VSRFSRERICHHLGVSRDKVGVVHGAADHMRALAGEPDVLGKLGVEPGRYFLAVGSANPTKNFSRLISAFKGMPQPDARLVVVGGSNDAVFSAIGADSRLDDGRIIRAGRLSDAELKALYTRARAYVFPSIYEGFGLPPLEAMLCGCPVIASHAASIPEICGPAAGYFDPFSVDSIRQMLERAMRDDAWLDELRAAGLRRAEMFTWDNSARGLLSELAQLGLVSARNQQLAREPGPSRSPLF
jgi:glycosyltransferase involved in cell wall biosynthesis